MASVVKIASSTRRRSKYVKYEVQPAAGGEIRKPRKASSSTSATKFKRKPAKMDVHSEVLIAFRRQYKGNLDVACPICDRRYKGHFMKKHVAIKHVTKKAEEFFSVADKRRIKAFKRCQPLSPAAKVRARKSKIKPVKRTQDQRELDRKKTSRPVLDPAATKAGGSDYTWATRHRKLN